MSYARNHQFRKYFNFNISSILNIIKNLPLKLDLLQRCQNDQFLIFSINIVDTLIRSQMFWKISITRSSLTIYHVQ